MPSVAASAAALPAVINTSNSPPAASAEAPNSASVLTAAPRPQAVTTNRNHHQQPAEHAESAELNPRPAESATVLGSQSHAHLSHDAEHAEFEQLQRTGLRLPRSIHGCAAAAASSAEGSSCLEGNKVLSGEFEEGVGCHDSSNVEEVIGRLLEAGRTMDDIVRTGSAAEEPARWGSGSRVSLMVSLL